MKPARIVIAILLVGLPPLGRYLSDFLAGYYCKPIGFLPSIYQLFFILLAPFIVGIAVGCLIPAKRIFSRVGIGIGAAIVSAVLAIVGVPAGAITYSHGFEHALHTKIGIEKLQRWSQEALEQYQLGQIKSAREPSYWNPGDVLISTNDLPVFLKTGIFKPSGIQNYGPEVSICRSGGKSGFSQNCIAVSWYLNGVLIGSPDFTNKWNAWYYQKIAPGVYSFHGMK